MSNKGEECARRILNECGFDNISEVPLEILVAGRGAFLRYGDLKGADGRIVFGKSGNAIITINQNIDYEGRRRFTIAHELGHFEMHKNIAPHLDSDFTFINYNKNQIEAEANQFATELLLPSDLFKKECAGKKFSPDLLREISSKFCSSITSVAFRYLDIGHHPIFIFFSVGNKVKYWKKSERYFQRVKDITNLPPPEDSVASEYFSSGKIYPKEESSQQIVKSTWFELSKYDDDEVFYEYCIITPKYNTVLSIVWQ